MQVFDDHYLYLTYISSSFILSNDQLTAARITNTNNG